MLKIFEKFDNCKCLTKKEKDILIEFMNYISDFNEKSNIELDCEIRRDLFEDIDKILKESL